MARQARRWTLEEVIDLEQALVVETKPTSTLKASVTEAARGFTGTEARSSGLRAWLEESRKTPSAGKRFTASLSLVAAGLGLLAWLAGISGVLGMLDRTRGGIDVLLFLMILLGIQWLILWMAVFAWIFRRQTARGFSGMQALLGKVVHRFSGDGDDWWSRLMDGGGAPRLALLWRLARLAQGAGICFNLGIISGLAGLVMVKNVGFFWETTTEAAMRDTLVHLVKMLSIPWSGVWPAAVPDASVIAASRWLPDQTDALPPGPAAWWLFLLMATFVWGMLPRVLWWVLADVAFKRALGNLDFQARHHRALWRELTGVDRVDTDEKPLDGVLVLDVGGSGLRQEDLRPFLLQKLRVHPASWHPVAVLDAGAESEAQSALREAPAGVVLLAEGWALSPPRMSALHAQIRSVAGPETPVKFLVANVAQGGSPTKASEVERKEWERFVDSLRDPFAEVFFFA